MKYLLIDDCDTVIFTEEFNTAEEAVKEGEIQFGRMTKIEKKRRRAFYVLESVNPNEDAPNHFDGNDVKVWI